VDRSTPPTVAFTAGSVGAVVGTVVGSVGTVVGSVVAAVLGTVGAEVSGVLGPPQATRPRTSSIVIRSTRIFFMLLPSLSIRLDYYTKRHPNMQYAAATLQKLLRKFSAIAWMIVPCISPIICYNPV
jgi:hypothetical protein